MTNEVPNYVADENGRAREVSIEIYLASLSDKDRRPKADRIGDAIVTTFFTGIVRVPGRQKPFLFETTIEGGRHSGFRLSWENHRQAIDGHDQIVAAIQSGASVHGYSFRTASWD